MIEQDYLVSSDLGFLPGAQYIVMVLFFYLEDLGPGLLRKIMFEPMKYMSVNKDFLTCLLIELWLCFVNQSETMAWCQAGDKALVEPYVA